MALPKSPASHRRTRRSSAKPARSPAARFADQPAHEPGGDIELERLLLAAARLRASRSLS